MKPLFLVWALLLCPAQSAPDEARIDRLIQLLASATIEEREKAQKELVEMGKTALPALRKAGGDPDLELQTRIRKIISDIEWQPLRLRDVAKDLTDEERTFLGQVGHLTRSNPIFVIKSLEALDPSSAGLEADVRPPQHEIWSFVDAVLFERSEVKGAHSTVPTRGGSSSQHGDKWVISGGSASLTIQSDFEHVVAGRGGYLAYKYLPFGLLETRVALDLSRDSLKWDETARSLPCLKAFMAPGPKNVSLQSTKIFEKDGKITGAYYQFDWDRTGGSMNTLRHLFVKEHWALFVLFTW
jgi:hypothetical protein